MEKVDGPNYRTVKGQLLEEMKDEFISMSAQEFSIQKGKIEQLRRNIENVIRVPHRYVYGNEEDSEADKNFDKMVTNSLGYYIEKLKEETVKMLKE